MGREEFFRKIAKGIVLSFIVVCITFVAKGGKGFGQVLFFDTLPAFDIDENDLLKKYDESQPVYMQDDDLIGVGEIIYQEDVDGSLESDKSENTEKITNINIEKLKNLQNLKSSYYIVDSKTAMSSDYFDIDKFINADLKIKSDGDKPKVLIFHTHSMEMFKDSNKNDINDGIVGAGARLCDKLNEYGIKTIHITDSFDVVNGKSQILGAYERMEPKIRQVLKENPSIEMVIDLHRDGVAETTRLVKEIDGKPTAQVMFFNGLCRINKNGKLTDIESLRNEYIPTNLALSFNMKRMADELYPNFTKKIYLNAYRYSLHLRPKSMLIEVGAQTNTKQEIYNAIDLLAEVIYKVTKP